MKNMGMNRKKGMILVIVIAAVMLMSVMVVGILSRNVSKSLVDEKSLQRYQAEQIAKGAFWRAYQNGGVLPADFVETVDGVDYNIYYTTTAGAGPGGTDQINVQVTY